MHLSEQRSGLLILEHLQMHRFFMKKEQMRKVQDVMNAFPISVAKSTSIMDVFRIIREKRLSHLLVVDESELVGVISKEDLLNKMVELSYDTTGKIYNDIILRTTPVSTIMSKVLITARPADSLADAVEHMLSAEIHCIPVVNETGQPVGLLNPMDVLKAYSAGIENIL